MNAKQQLHQHKPYQIGLLIGFILLLVGGYFWIHALNTTYGLVSNAGDNCTDVGFSDCISHQEANAKLNGLALQGRLGMILGAIGLMIMLVCVAIPRLKKP